jgi:DNA-binding NtrC family response regulator
MNNRNINLVEYINELKSTNDFCSAKLIENISEIDAYHIEQVFINYFGRLDNGTGILFNKNYGGSTILRKVNNVEFNLEFQRVASMLKALNTSSTIKIAAKKINMNLRTFYRLLKKYEIKRNKLSNSWIIEKI